METNSAERPQPKTEMAAKDVISLHGAFSEAGVGVWIDGGWGVDALLCQQTRPHSDLDIALEGKDESKVKAVLTSLGYSDVPRDDTRAWNYVLGDSSGHQIDLHIINLDENGDGIYGPPENGEKYPASALTGVGNIEGHEVRCISAEDMVKFHSGYTLKEKDYHDVSALCAKFDIPLPEEYSRFVQERSAGL